MMNSPPLAPPSTSQSHKLQTLETFSVAIRKRNRERRQGKTHAGRCRKQRERESIDVGRMGRKIAITERERLSKLPSERANLVVLLLVVVLLGDGDGLVDGFLLAGLPLGDGFLLAGLPLGDVVGVVLVR